MGKRCNIYSCGAFIFALVLLVLAIITAFVDSSTIINRWFSTAHEWNIPLATIALIFAGIATHKKEGKKQILNIITVLLLVAAFGFTNTKKNMVQDHISNAGNYVEVVSEALNDEADKVYDWRNDIKDGLKEVSEVVEASEMAAMKRDMSRDKRYGSSSRYDDYDDYNEYDDDDYYW